VNRLLSVAFVRLGFVIFPWLLRQVLWAVAFKPPNQTLYPTGEHSMSTPTFMHRVLFGLLTAAGWAGLIQAQGPGRDFKAAVAELKKYDCYEISTGTVTPATKHLSFGCHSKLPDAAFPHLAAFPNLESLDFISNKVTDACLVQLRNLPKLRSLEINSATITDKGLDSLKELPKLEELTLMRTQVTAQGLAKVQALKGLKTLHLMRLKTTPALIEQLKRFKHLDHLDIGQTEFTAEQRLELTKALPNLSIDEN
jgi:Leucine-rich repeat (LRR) protein